VVLALCVLYFGVVAVLSAYGLHRMYLVLLCRKHRAGLDRAVVDARRAAADAERRAPSELPFVTVQLPIFNESTVANRLLDAVAKFQYPRDRWEIQVLDDSTDETQAIAHAHVERLRALGLDASYLHRVDRVGYKAGALENGLASAKGSLVAMFDADFVPQADFLQSVVHHFDDPAVAMVQTRWGHINREVSLLTRSQALQLDGHHLVENRARFAGGYFFNFSGTGGVWRREAIVDAGGWEHDTLTEDLDLSYRAQLRGWKFVYREDVVTPSELPEEVSAVRAQQYRWAKGTVQTARKLLGRVLRSDQPLSHKIEAFFHVTPHFAYPLIVLMSVLLLPSLLFLPAGNGSAVNLFLVDLPLLLATTGSLAAFSVEAMRAQGRRRTDALLHLPLMIAMGTGLAPHMSRAVFDGLRNMAGEFVRTPKQGTNKHRYRIATELPFTEAALFLVSLTSVAASVAFGHWFAIPFAMLFAFGYGYVTVLVTREQVRGRRRLVTGLAASNAEATPTPLPSRGAEQRTEGVVIS
jgi:hypothetical protein